MKKYKEMQRVLEEDRRISLLEMEETATVQALDHLINENCVLLKDIEIQLNEELMDNSKQPGEKVSLHVCIVFIINIKCNLLC